ncbi:ABC transporter permease [Rhodococcus sp. DMU1]|uniref:ABC transporter permease n=1 Tax=Rhodococcus sp. DMU1 TaxID=2722825 RepID=UPI00143EEDAE|nr:ABC transporter permease [Rhodococcus sp. DMU1]QIX48426.1 ABC transporter permease [Rhodococcus sp. DMU1]
MVAPTSSPDTSTARHAPPDAVRVAGVVLALTAVIALMLFAFAAPAVNSGPHALKIGIAGPDQAVAQIEAGLSGARPGAFAPQRYADAEALRSAIEHREVVGGLAVGPDGPAMYVAGAGGAPVAQVLTATATGLSEAVGRPIPVRDVVPLPADDPAGAGLNSLALPLVLGGLVPAIALVRLFPRRVGLRVFGAVGFAVLAGLTLTAVLQFGFGSLTGNYWATAGALTLGLAAVSLPLLGLESLFGLPGFGAGAVLMMFVGNPLSGFATTAAWLPQGWGTFGQLLPPGAAGTLVRSVAFFDGHGGGTAVLVLSAWVVAGLALCAASARRRTVVA